MTHFSFFKIIKNIIGIFCRAFAPKTDEFNQKIKNLIQYFRHSSVVKRQHLSYHYLKLKGLSIIN